MASSDTPQSRLLPQFPQSLWKHTTELPLFPRLQGETSVDVAIVGGGITGLTTAYLLMKEGLQVAVLEMGTLLHGTTGHTTAKITSQHGLIYDELTGHFGEAQAKLYYEANEEALGFMRSLAQEHQIDCSMTEEAAYLFAESDQELKKLEKEWKAYQKLGLPGEWLETVPLPMAVKGAIKLPGQARFHPLHYLKFMIEELQKGGAAIYEHTMVDAKVEKVNGRLKLQTEQGASITCNYAVSASHFPFYDGGAMYFSRLHAERSYVTAIQPETSFEGGMYISCGNPKHSLRAAEWEGKTLVLVGGEGHKTGKSDCTISRYEALEQYGASLFGAKSIPFRWSAQDLFTLDRVPYIGQATNDDPHILIATGFAKWGMSSGTLAALMLRDRIMKRDNRYEDLYTPQRFKADPGIKTFIVQNAEVAKDLVAGKVGLVHRKAEELANDEGAVVKHLGKRAGAYKDHQGRLYLVDTTCTHMGCEVDWNEGERSWDCPCHGSRFNYKGEVIEGPATKPLTPLSQTQDKA
ncbi:FAD-dependent oxidoreductase [Paenibacillus pinistramenti]|uniref:FAD-dependent oxidoreductase n=1 Tax=Paenibacillus pinistramenti TaxID=1768003 RepID=UPI001107F5A1|nr:FAD-dependent oxidoreductase [Paenibacillus pinistramenti]